MQTEFIFTTLLAAAGFLKRPIRDVAGQSIKDAYDAAKSYLAKKFGDRSDVATALEAAIAKPESLLRKAQLVAASAAAELENDANLVQLIERLASLLPVRADSPTQHVHVSGENNQVQLAGRDLIHTEKIVRRNTITPDERHLSVEQRDRLRGLIRELAERISGANGRGGISAVHAMLQRRFQVPSYLLISREQYEDAVRFLRQQRAIHRSRLRDRDPVAYANDFYRSIFAGGRELGWDGQRVYLFATEKLALKTAVSSLKELGPIQLRALADFVQREVRVHRTNLTRPSGTSA